MNIDAQALHFRLGISESGTTICGLLPRHPGGGSSGYLYIRQPCPAEISYILGPDWKSHIIVTTSNNLKHKEWSYISIPNDPVNEANHCFRITRCGAMREGLPSFGPQWPPDPLNKKMKVQIMGWPSDGSVWVFPKSSIPEDLGGFVPADLRGDLYTKPCC